MDADKTPVIVAATRTPIGKFLGGLSSLTAPQLGAIAVREAVRRAGVDAKDVDEVILGQVVQGGSGQAPARQAAIHAGLPGAIPSLTINKVCGSGLKAVMLAAQSIKAGDNRVVVAAAAPGAEVAAVVKADAYGLGAGPIARRLWAEGTRTFFVARLAEGEALRAGARDGRCPARPFFQRPRQASRTAREVASHVPWRWPTGRKPPVPT